MSVTDELMCMRHSWNDTDGGETEVLKEKSVLVPLWGPMNPTWTAMALKMGLCSDKLVTNHPS